MMIAESTMNVAASYCFDVHGLW